MDVYVVQPGSMEMYPQVFDTLPAAMAYVEQRTNRKPDYSCDRFHEWEWKRADGTIVWRVMRRKVN